MTISSPSVSSTPRMIPGPKPMPVVNWRGNYIKFMRDPAQYLYRLYNEYGPLCSFIEAPDHQRGNICVFDPQYNQFVLSNADLFYSRTVSMDAGKDTPLGRLGMGLPVINGDQHRKQRRLIMPAFHKKQVEAYHSDMISITQQALDGWKIGETRNMAHELRYLTLRLVVKSLFGIDQTLAEPVGHMLEQWLKFNVSAGLMPIDLPGTPMRRLRNLSSRLEQTLLGIINEKRAAGAQGNDIISMLIQARDDDGTAMADHEIVGEVNLLFAAGGDTTANMLSWTLFLLAQHPHILGDVVDELEGVLHGSEPSLEQLRELPLLDRVIKESMRILNPITFSTRESTREFDIGPYHFAKTTLVVFSPLITHRLPHLYSDAAKFIPDRWLTIDPGPYEYLPFGTGVRMCIGSNFAMLQMKVILSLLLQRFRLNLVPHTIVDRQETSSTMTPRYGLPMTIHAQDHQFSHQPIRGNILEMVDLPDSSAHQLWTLKSSN